MYLGDEESYEYGDYDLHTETFRLLEIHEFKLKEIDCPAEKNNICKDQKDFKYKVRPW